MDSERVKAIAWWNNLTDNQKQNLCNLYLDSRHFEAITGREIQIIYNKT